jgi:hypothetical protein
MHIKASVMRVFNGLFACVFFGFFNFKLFFLKYYITGYFAGWARGLLRTTKKP